MPQFPRFWELTFSQLMILLSKLCSLSWPLQLVMSRALWGAYWLELLEIALAANVHCGHQCFWCPFCSSLQYGIFFSDVFSFDMLLWQQGFPTKCHVRMCPTFLIGCLPTYAHVGWLSTAMLVVLRLLQGIAIGGEYVSALVFSMEHAPGSKKTISGALMPFGCNISRDAYLCLIACLTCWTSFLFQAGVEVVSDLDWVCTTLATSKRNWWDVRIHVQNEVHFCGSWNLQWFWCGGASTAFDVWRSNEWHWLADLLLVGLVGWCCGSISPQQGQSLVGRKNPVPGTNWSFERKTRLCQGNRHGKKSWMLLHFAFC